MSYEPRFGVVRILTADEVTAGSGFLVSDGDKTLAVTCAHVFEEAGIGPGETATLAPVADPKARLHGRVEPQFWRPGDAEDVAVVTVTSDLPPACLTLTLSLELGAGPHQTWGFPTLKPDAGLAATVEDLAPATEDGIAALSGRSHAVSLGYSGAPVWDEASHAVTGMVISVAPADRDPERRQNELMFMRGSELLAKVCPRLFPAVENPYRGLEVFEESDQFLYHGRDRAIEQLLDALAREDFVAVIGISGSGKSSLARAGLAKGLAGRRVAGVAGKRRVQFRPGPVPQLDMLVAIGAGEVAELAAASEADPEALARLFTAPALRAALPEGAILVVDQFERVFTECPDERLRAQFIDTLLDVASLETKVLVTLRADFYGRVLELPRLAERVERGRTTLLAMTRQELLEAVELPAAACNRRLAPRLADQLVTDVAGTPGDLPLLQLALTELWERDGGGGVLKLTTYDEIGERAADGAPLRIRGVIAQLAEREWAKLSETEQLAATRLLAKLVAPAPTEQQLAQDQHAARRAWQSEWSEDEASREVAAKLVDARLLTSGRDPIDGEPTIEVAHEALIWAWPRLARLATEHADFLRWYHGELGPMLRYWGLHGRTEENVLRGSALIAAERWLSLMAELLEGPPTAFIAASVAAREREEERRREEAAREQERRLAVSLSESTRLATEALAAADSEPETALLVAWEALLRDRNEWSDSAFRRILARMPAAVRILADGLEFGSDSGYTGDGSLVFAVVDGAVALWTREGERVEPLAVPGSGALHAAAVPGEALIVTHRGGLLRLQEHRGSVLAELAVPDGGAIREPGDCDLSLSKSGRGLLRHGRRAFTFEVDNRSLRSGASIRLVAEIGEGGPDELDTSLHEPVSNIFAAAMSPTGRLFLTEGSGSIRLWAADGSPISAVGDRPFTFAILVDDTIATGGLDGKGELSDSTGSQLCVFEKERGLDLAVRAVAPDGGCFVAAYTEGGDLRLRSASGDLLRSWDGSGRAVRSAAFSADGTSLGVGLVDGSIAILPLEAEAESVPIAAAELTLAGHSDQVDRVDFDPGDAGALVSTDIDGTLRMWHVEQAAYPDLEAHGEEVLQMITTAAGVISVSGDERALLWYDGSGRELPGRPIGPPVELGDATLLCVKATDETVSVLRLATGVSTTVFQVLRRNGVEQIDRAILHASGALAGWHREDAFLWSPRGEMIGALRGEPPSGVSSRYEQIVGVGFDRDGTRVVSGAVNGAIWIHGSDGRLLSTSVVDYGAEDRLFALAVDPRGEMIATGVRQKVGLWSWDGEAIGSLPTGGNKPQALVFFAGGEGLFTLSDRQGRVWRHGREMALDLLDAKYREWTAAPADWPYVVLPVGSGVAIVDADGTRLGSIAAAGAREARACAVSPDGDLVAAAFSNGAVRIWSRKRGRRITTLELGAVTALAFSPDSELLLAALPSGALSVHPVDVARLYPRAVRRTPRRMSTEEQERFAIADIELDDVRLAELRTAS